MIPLWTVIIALSVTRVLVTDRISARALDWLATVFIVVVLVRLTMWVKLRVVVAMGFVFGVGLVRVCVLVQVSVMWLLDRSVVEASETTVGFPLSGGLG